MKQIPNENLTLTNAREPNNSEHMTGAEGVLEFECQETGAKTKVLMSGRNKEPFSWIPEDQKYVPENGQQFLLEISQTVKDWSMYGCKFVKKYNNFVNV